MDQAPEDVATEATAAPESSFSKPPLTSSGSTAEDWDVMDDASTETPKHEPPANRRDSFLGSMTRNRNSIVGGDSPKRRSFLASSSKSDTTAHQAQSSSSQAAVSDHGKPEEGSEAEASEQHDSTGVKRSADTTDGKSTEDAKERALMAQKLESAEKQLKERQAEIESLNSKLSSTSKTLEETQKEFAASREKLATDGQEMLRLRQELQEKHSDLERQVCSLEDLSLGRKVSC